MATTGCPAPRCQAFKDGRVGGTTGLLGVCPPCQQLPGALEGRAAGPHSQGGYLMAAGAQAPTPG